MLRKLHVAHLSYLLLFHLLEFWLHTGLGVTNCYYDVVLTFNVSSLDSFRKFKALWLVRLGSLSMLVLCARLPCSQMLYSFCGAIKFRKS